MEIRCAAKLSACPANDKLSQQNLVVTKMDISPKPALDSEPIYQSLQARYNQQGKQIKIKDLFASDPSRFDKYR